MDTRSTLKENLKHVYIRYDFLRLHKKSIHYFGFGF